MAENYQVNYEDERFDQVEQDKQAALKELEDTYSGMIEQSDNYFKAQENATKEWADKQSQLQQEQTDFLIEQTEQQKAQAEKDYIKEQSGAYVDWQKQSNKYGANAEAMASAGLAKTGYSESSQVSMYNTYQNRVASARESYSRAVLNYDNAIKEAMLQNNAALAEIAFQALLKQLELSLQGFQYKNQLVLDQFDKKLTTDEMYYSRYMDVLQQINTENAMAEEKRQFEKSYDLQLKQFDEDVRQFNEQMALQKSNSSSSSGSDSGSDSGNKKLKIIKNATVKEKDKSTSPSKGEQNRGSGLLETNGAYDYFNSLITSGASKSRVLSEIATAEKSGNLTKQEAQRLRDRFAPKGHEYT